MVNHADEAFSKLPKKAHWRIPDQQDALAHFDFEGLKSSDELETLVAKRMDEINVPGSGAGKTNLPELPGWEGSLSARRLVPGAASHGSDLPRIIEGQTWLKGTAGNAGKVPAQIAEKLNGREFSDFNKFRKAFWQEVAADPVLSKQFSPSNVTLMKSGKAPYAHETQQIGSRVQYELDHMEELQYGGSVYDMNNI
ncbi:hypothetical protein [Pseudodesulfovibrio sediminis]|uniref:Uncharacterized protein n=1 Tax=Pseudodesulfovibrio sediminis TaxID=2810563 RepID=A0ABN6EPY0_9BACT|nr:hypothetical protein [Pseudodesulfovibrio sediminis]BCS88467.1 hypothetical protein PSDVSF_17090 [Pseudodesulfovibrio sediminis]